MSLPGLEMLRDAGRLRRCLPCHTKGMAIQRNPVVKIPGTSERQGNSCATGKKIHNADALREKRLVSLRPPQRGPVRRLEGLDGRPYPMPRAGPRLAIFDRGFGRCGHPAPEVFFRVRWFCRLKGRGRKRPLPGSHRPAERVGETIFLGSEFGGWGHIRGSGKREHQAQSQAVRG